MTICTSSTIHSHRNPSRPDRRRQTLLIDADDTLWENNIYFLDVTERFLDAVQRHNVDREQARHYLTEVERRNIPRHGYGSRSFALSVVEAFRELSAAGDAAAEEELRALAHGIFDREELELLAGVEAALAQLSARCRLVLVTKGDHDEQMRKLARSGLARYFGDVVVVPEKDEAVYREIAQRLSLRPADTWMVGNSPRSDINPALAAGLSAVLIPHPSTWELEIEEVADGGERLLVVASMEEVAKLFAPSGTIYVENAPNTNTLGSDPGTPTG